MKAFWIVLVLLVAGVVGMPGANAWPGTLNGRPALPNIRHEIRKGFV
jgi:hypothetical protein